jgi:hypothetical protein
MKFKIKTDNLTKTIDTDDLRKEEGKMFGTTSSVIEIKEDE